MMTKKTATKEEKEYCLTLFFESYIFSIKNYIFINYLVFLMLIASLDVGTTSIRLSFFTNGSHGAEDTNMDGMQQLLSMEQKTLSISYPKESWVEQDPMEIIGIISDFHGFEKFNDDKKLKCLGLTNQRESIVFWSKKTGLPLCNAIVWMDSRTHSTLSEVDKFAFQKGTNLPLSTYPSASKIDWIFKNIPSALEHHKRGDLLIGTIDSWVLWKLTLSSHFTDPTNAHRTGLTNLQKPYEWSDSLISLWKNIPSDVKRSLPTISNGSFGTYKGFLITSIIGDQHASMVGHSLSAIGDLKITLGTGAFMMMISNLLPEEIVNKGLIGTIAYVKPGGCSGEIIYGIEAAIGCASKAIDWLIEIGLLNDPIMEIPLILQRYDSNLNDNTYRKIPLFFPYLSGGSLCPRWKGDDEASFHDVGIRTSKEDLIIGVIEGVLFSIRQCFTLMKEFIPGKNGIGRIVIDGGLSASSPLMQLLSNILGHQLHRPHSKEMTSIGAAIGAGLIINNSTVDNYHTDKIFVPQETANLEKRYRRWEKILENK